MDFLQRTFERTRQEKRAAIVGYITAGDPDVERSFEIIDAACANGLDVLELGIPFSDPMADGVVIQKASGRAIKAGMTLAKGLEIVRELRKRHDLPIILFSYFNPIFIFGVEKFVREALGAGVDGVLVVDLPAENAAELMQHVIPKPVWAVGFAHEQPLRDVTLACSASGISKQLGHNHNNSNNDVTKNAEITTSPRGQFHFIRLIAPTTDIERRRKILHEADGFVYVISRHGVTGGNSNKIDWNKLGNEINSMRQETNTPICVGFGISTPQDVQAVGKIADGAIIGSAIQKLIEIDPNNAKQSVSKFIESLR